jgi:DNA processing protein
MKSNIVNLKKSEFPKLLREIPDCPKQLNLNGTLPLNETKLLAVVGSRRYTEYGKSICEKLISELRGYDIAIVSGLALGIDSIAHRAALKAGLKTIAVPGSGLDESVLYPSSHRELAKQILNEGGALLSEFPNDMKAAPYTFPKIIAGMSHGTLIIEATQKSGTLITARLAMEYNREVLTVPGSIYSTSSFGPHSLIKVGATPVTDYEDILEALNTEKIDSPIREMSSLSPIEKAVYELLNEPVSKEDIFNKIKAPDHVLNMTLSAMEIKGLIEESLGKVHRVR